MSQSEAAASVVTPESLIAWFEASGLHDDGSEFTRRILRSTGEFLQRSGQLSEELVLQLLADVDFSQPVTVARLPQTTFVRSDAVAGGWYTDTGLTVEQVRAIRGPRRGQIYSPISVIPALKATSRTVQDGWTKDQLFGNVAPQLARQHSQLAAGGTQYLVFEEKKLRPI
ncbi:MAG: hypothetical protein KDA96_21410 [Planctomycetaceae bacterium]|nr:hypothetical protein [Planctomycetaceae bacterium]MCA9065647.1 hypothetical protein [Planctomycetaceae bacterium]